MSVAQDNTKARLLDAAGEEFAEKGFEGATIRSIIERPDTGKKRMNTDYLSVFILFHLCLSVVRL